MDHKTANKPNQLYRYRTGQTGFKIRPFYDPKTGQVFFAQIPAYRRKTGKTGSKTGQAGFVPFPMYMTKTGKTGFKNFPLYKTKTGQAGYVPIPMYSIKKGKKGFKNFPLYDSKNSQAGYLPIPMYMTKTGKTSFKNFPLYDTRTGQAGFVNNPLYKQTDLNQLAMYQMAPGQSAQLPSIPGIVPYNAASGLVPMLDTPTQQTQPMYLNSPPVLGMNAPLLPANQMSMMYPTGMTGETGLTGFDNGLMNPEGLSLPGFPGLSLASPALQASEALAESVLGQANAQAKSTIIGPKKQNDPSITVSVDGVVRSVVKQGGSAVKLDAGGASISLSKKNKVFKQIKKKRQ